MPALRVQEAWGGAPGRVHACPLALVWLWGALLRTEVHPPSWLSCLSARRPVCSRGPFLLLPLQRAHPHCKTLSMSCPGGWQGRGLPEGLHLVLGWARQVLASLPSLLSRRRPCKEISSVVLWMSFLVTDMSAEQSSYRAGLYLTSKSHGFKLSSIKISNPKSSKQFPAEDTDGVMARTVRTSTWLIFCHRSRSSTS